MSLKKFALLLAGILCIAALWLCWWLAPERQIPRAQARFLSALAARDFDAAGALVAADYADRWEHDRASLLLRCREVFGQFVILEIEREPRGLRAESGKWRLSEKITMRGIGGPIAITVRDVVNALREPFVMEWRQRSGKPWDWELKSVAQPEIGDVER